MCLAVISHGELSQWPVFVAANRDEYYDRSSRPPRVITAGDTLVLAPTDRRAGGTWIGINDQHVFAVITNRSDLDQNPPQGAPSRGILVMNVLAAGSLENALEVVRKSAGQQSAPFNLVVGDSRSIMIAERTEKSLELKPLPVGCHIVSNRGAVNDDSIGEVKRARQLWAAAMARGDDPEEAARNLLSVADPDPALDLPSILKIGSDRGTVSSTIFAIGDDDSAFFLHADGALSGVGGVSQGYVLQDYVSHDVPMAVAS